MARGPNWRRVTFSREEILREHLTYREQPAPKPKPRQEMKPVKVETWNPFDSWMD